MSRYYMDTAIIDAYLRDQFRPERVTDIFPKKGMQDNNAEHVWKVYTATFANDSVIREIISRGEQDVMLYTHHPRPPMPDLRSSYSENDPELLKSMKANRITLCSYHIPMDAGWHLSPAFTLGEAMGANIYDYWYPQNGGLIGVLCNIGLQTLDQLAERLRETLGHDVSCYDYGGPELSNGRFGIMPGCAKSSECYQFLHDSGINCMVTGVTTLTQDMEWLDNVHEAARAAGVSILGGTHCSTEQFAPRKMVQYFCNLGLESEFIPEEPNMDEIAY